MMGYCRKARPSWPPATARNSPRCATAPTRRRGCGPSRKNASRVTGENDRARLRRDHLLVIFDLFLSRRLLGCIVIAQGGAVRLGDAGAGRHDAGGRATGDALVAEKFGDRGGIFVVGHPLGSPIG